MAHMLRNFIGNNISKVPLGENFLGAKFKMAAKNTGILPMIVRRLVSILHTARQNSFLLHICSTAIGTSRLLRLTLKLARNTESDHLIV